MELPRNAIDIIQFSQQQDLHLLFAPPTARADPNTVQAILPHRHHRHLDNYCYHMCRLQSGSVPACIEIVEHSNSRTL